MKDKVYEGVRLFCCLLGEIILPLFIHNLLSSVPLILGVVAAALSDIDDNLIGRIRYILLSLLCFSIASFSIGLLFHFPLLMTIGLLCSTFAFTLMGALGQRYASLPFGALLIAAYTMLGYDLYNENSYLLSLLLLAGTL